jgi:hypothetical protein
MSEDILDTLDELKARTTFSTSDIIKYLAALEINYEQLAKRLRAAEEVCDNVIRSDLHRRCLALNHKCEVWLTIKDVTV